jgi:SAM-dependent methyltransferase
MRRIPSIVVFAFVLPLLLFNISSIAQEYKPTVGQQGKDVIWVPTSDALVEAMLDMAEVTSFDYVMDLGSGDGRIVIAAARRGATAVGIEYNPDMVELSKQNAAKAGVSDRATFLQADIFETDFSKASVITMYLLPALNLKLRPQLLELAPGTRITSHSFTMGGWEPDQTTMEEGQMAYLWIVPAKINGEWTWQDSPGEATLRLTQDFQKFGGTLEIRGESLPVGETQLRGDFISFKAGDLEYSGRVNKDSIRGSVRSQNGERQWTASRALQTGLK